MEGKFLVQCLENTRYLVNGNTINNNDKHLLTSYYVRHRTQHFTWINFNPYNNSELGAFSITPHFIDDDI